MSIQSPRVPPQSAEAEFVILGTSMLSKQAATMAISELSPQDFYKPANAEIFSTMCGLWGESMGIDMISVINNLKDSGKIESIGGVHYITELCGVVPVVSQIKGLCRIVKEKSRSRSLILASSEVVDMCYNGTPIADAVGLLWNKTVGLLAESTDNTRGIAEITKSLIAHISDIHEGKKSSFGMSTGFDGFDKILGGLQKAEVTVIAGRPAMGKTTFAMNIAHNCAKAGKEVLIFSMEMSSERLVQKIISTISGVNTTKMDRGLMLPQQMADVIAAADLLRKLPITIDESSALGVAQIQSKAKLAAMKKPIDLIIVDYLQLSKAKAASREQEITAISAGLKALSKDLNVPVIALSQLSRKCEERTDKRPLMSDLRESGSIEQDAGVIAFIYRDEVYNTAPDNPLKNVAEVIIRKNRYGNPGTVDMFFDGEKCRFMDMAREQPEPKADFTPENAKNDRRKSDNCFTGREGCFSVRNQTMRP